jgi:hypothetical protein
MSSFRTSRSCTALLSAGLLAASALPAAACPQELAVYSEPDAEASLEFTPAGESAAVTHSFKVKFRENATMLDGIVMWTQEVPRPVGMLTHQCPEGDVTGTEIDACTVWQGVVYALGADGKVGLLPETGAKAAQQLVLADLAASLRHSSIHGPQGIARLPSDVFSLSGCQE